MLTAMVSFNGNCPLKFEWMANGTLLDINNMDIVRVTVLQNNTAKLLNSTLLISNMKSDKFQLYDVSLSVSPCLGINRHHLLMNHTNTWIFQTDTSKIS